MPPKLLAAFSSEWFSVALGTTATSVAVYWISALHHIPILRWVGLAFLIIGATSFAVISVLWAARGLAFPDLIGSDSRNLNRVSFTAVMPLEMIALGTALQLYLGTPRAAFAELLSADYFAAFAVSMSLSVLEGYLLYTRKEISGGDLTYALMIPPVSVSTGVLLAPSLVQIAPGLAPLADFLVAGGLGVSFMLFIFIGSLGLAAHVREVRTPESIPVAIFPVGVSSILVINILFLSSIGFIQGKLALMIAIAFWGFEFWNLLVMTAVSAASLRGRPPMSVWAYLFPLTIFWVSSIRISALLASSGYSLPSMIVIAAGTAVAVAILPLWAYSVYASALLLRWLTSLSRAPAPADVVAEGEEGGKSP
ncbi:MAG: hypothetical protein RXP97_04515 [Nitrososphaeria archaeon]